MNTNKKILYTMSLITIVCGIMSCDKVEPPFNETPSGGNNGGAIVQRKILLEDFTGHTCKNCPAASEIAKNLSHDIYPGRVVVMAIHSGFYADTAPQGPFIYNFKTPEGDQISTDFGVNSWPNGMLNRVKFNGAPLINPGSWASNASTIINQPADASLIIENSYNAANRVLTTTVNTKALKALSGKYNLCVFYTEDSIIKPQIVDNTTELNYIHMHALRGCFNNAYGDQIFDNAAANDSIVKTYSLTLRNDAVPQHCSVVAYLMKAADKTVLQAEEKKVQ